MNIFDVWHNHRSIREGFETISAIIIELTTKLEDWNSVRHCSAYMIGEGDVQLETSF